MKVFKAATCLFLCFVGLTAIGFISIASAESNESSDSFDIDTVEIVFNEVMVDELELIETEDDADLETEVDDEASEDEASDLLKIGFAQGYLLLNQDDYGTWDYSHILALRVRQSAEDSYSFDATVRHRDEGWEHYADMFRIVPADGDSTVENGERVLLHPHDNEQPFTRSQSRVLATGVVCIEARDNVHEWGGSSLCLDLTKLDFNDGPINISWKLNK